MIKLSQRTWMILIIALIAAVIIIALLFSSSATTGNEEARVQRATATPSPTATNSPTPTATPTFTPAPTATFTPTPTPIPPRAIHTSLRQQAWLETARENVIFPDLYASRDRVGPGTGRDSLRYNAVITVTAGIDLNLLPVENIMVDGTTVTLLLPAPQMRDCIIDEQKSFYYDERCSVAGVSTGGCDPLKDVLRERAFDAIFETDFESLREKAFSEAEEVISELVYNLDGIEDVIIERSTDEVPLFSEDGTCSVHQED